MQFNSQSLQDKFVLAVLSEKKNGFFLEIGSNDPKNINNSYILEKEYNWDGLMVEYDRTFEQLYKSMRTSKYIIKDATTIDYASVLNEYNFPNNVDYLQIDLEVNNESTIKTLEVLNSTVFDTYTFSTVTFEHDIYTGNYFNTRNRSREIFHNRGYVMVFADVKCGGNPYEDWYVHPAHVDMSLVNRITSGESLEYTEISNRLDRNYTFASINK
jgi:hypothetical protein